MPEPLYTVETYGELRPHDSREWLLTNGTGSYAMSTVVGCNTRRYHGLLVAATLPPIGRVMSLNRVEETLYVDARPAGGTARGDDDSGISRRPYELAVNHFPEGLIAPRGDRYLRSFELGNVARWVYDADGTTVIKEVQLLWHKPAVLLRYTLIPPPGRAARLHLRPFVSLRDFHALRRGGDTHFVVKPEGPGDEHGNPTDGRLVVRPHDRVLKADVSLHLRACLGDGKPARFASRPDWWYAHVYPLESARGLDDREDLFTPGHFELTAASASQTRADVATEAPPDGPVDPPRTPATLTPAGATLSLWCSLESTDGYGDFQAELDRRRERTRVRPMPTPSQKRLARAADAFVVYRPTYRPVDRSGGVADYPAADRHGSGTTIVAGYPWFADWGRDTMIALPGLLLASGRHPEAGRVLCLFAEYVSEGMIPNRFDDYTNEPYYNTVDASLWFVHAVHEYLRFSKDRDTYDALLRPACEQILAGYTRGTRFDIRVDPADGLVTAGDADTQLTWMDAKTGGVAFTPRHGKAVEINALWYHALRLMGHDDDADRTRDGFRAAFVQPDADRGLIDVVSPDGPDAAIRPNQLFAVSLTHSPLTPGEMRGVVDVCRRHLLTPFGLRSLSREDPHYRPVYAGSPFERDRAYHNGTVWPWLVGPFLDAYLRVHRHSKSAQRQARLWLRPLIDELSGGVYGGGCLGGVAEIYEGKSPHRTDGCPAQAWSVAEVLRLAVELEM